MKEENNYNRTDFGLDTMGCLLPRAATQPWKQDHSDTLRTSPLLEQVIYWPSLINNKLILGFMWL